MTAEPPRKLFTGSIGRVLFIARHAGGEGWGWREDQTVPTKLGLFWYRSSEGAGPALVLGEVKLAALWLYREPRGEATDGVMSGWGWPA